MTNWRTVLASSFEKLTHDMIQSGQVKPGDTIYAGEDIIDNGDVIISNNEPCIFVGMSDYYKYGIVVQSKAGKQYQMVFSFDVADGEEGYADKFMIEVLDDTEILTKKYKHYLEHILAILEQYPDITRDQLINETVNRVIARNRNIRNQRADLQSMKNDIGYVVGILESEYWITEGSSIGKIRISPDAREKFVALLGG